MRESLFIYGYKYIVIDKKNTNIVRFRKHLKLLVEIYK